MIASENNDLPRRITLVHEWFTPRSTGGAELVVEAIDTLLTDLGRQPQLAALVDGESRRPGSWLSQRSILTSLVQELPWGISHIQQYLPLLPMAIEQLDLGAAELVISSNHSWPKASLRRRISSTSVTCIHLFVTHGIKCTPIWSDPHWFAAD